MSTTPIFPDGITDESQVVENVTYDYPKIHHYQELEPIIQKIGTHNPLSSTWSNDSATYTAMYPASGTPHSIYADDDIDSKIPSPMNV